MRTAGRSESPTQPSMTLDLQNWMLLASLLHENFTTLNTAPPPSLLSQAAQVNLRFLFVCLLFPFANPLSSCYYKCASGSGHWEGSQLSSAPHLWSNVHLPCSTMSLMRGDTIGLIPAAVSTWRLRNSLWREEFTWPAQTAVLGKAHLQSWPWLKCGNLNGKQFPTLI